MHNTLSKLCILFFVVVLAISTTPHISYADIVELQQEIGARNQEINKLEEEIKVYQEHVEKLGKDKQTLNTKIQSLSVTDKKLTTDIRLTEKKISQTSLSIEKLALEIELKKKRISENSRALGRALRAVHSLESNSFEEIVLLNETLSAFWDKTFTLAQFENSVRQNVALLKTLKTQLEEKKYENETTKKNFNALKGQLVDQKNIVVVNKSEKQKLLKETNNKESSYKNLLADRLAKKNALEAEIAEFEARIRVEIDPRLLPQTGSGVLKWPTDTVTITQYFGNTSFATQNPQVYNGKGHNGIDLRAPLGTPIKSAGEGIVVDIGDTDAACYKVSYGRWVLIRHNNGLTTLYAHLSLIKVNAGQSVAPLDIIGYSGNTGYSTGPHVHFAVFATQAVQVTSNYRSKICGTYLKLPVASQNGYLNPLSYL